MVINKNKSKIIGFYFLKILVLIFILILNIYPHKRPNKYQSGKKILIINRDTIDFCKIYKKHEINESPYYSVDSTYYFIVERIKKSHIIIYLYYITKLNKTKLLIGMFISFKDKKEFTAFCNLNSFEYNEKDSLLSNDVFVLAKGKGDFDFIKFSPNINALFDTKDYIYSIHDKKLKIKLFKTDK